jgi:hypothetical protein
VTCQGSVVLSALYGGPCSYAACDVSFGYIQMGTGNMKLIEVFVEVIVQRNR